MHCHGIGDQANDVVAFRGEQLGLVAELGLVGAHEAIGRRAGGGRREDVVDAVRGSSHLAQHLRVLHRFGLHEQRLRQAELPRLPQDHDGVGRVRADHDAIGVGRLDLRQLSTQVGRTRRIFLLEDDRAAQLRELRLERVAAPDAAFIVDMQHRDLPQTALLIEKFCEDLAPEIARRNDAEDEIARIGDLRAGRRGADQSDFVRLGLRSHRQGDAAADRAQNRGQRRGWAREDLVECCHSFGRLAAIVLDDELQCTTAEPAGGIDLVDRELGAVAHRDPPMRRVSGQRQHGAKHDRCVVGGQGNRD